MLLEDQYSESELSWLLSDNQGTVRDVVQYIDYTDPGVTGKNTHISYDAFGQVTTTTGWFGTGSIHFTFQGRERDPESDLQYHRARYYEVATGIWINEDPLGFAAGDYNLRRFVGNSPTWARAFSRNRELTLLAAHPADAFLVTPATIASWNCRVDEQGSIVDHCSRRIIDVGVFEKHPNCHAICTFLGHTIGRSGAKPRYIICDRDSIFDCDAFQQWVRRKGIKPPRYGAVGKHGSIAVVERTIRTLETEGMRRITMSKRRKDFRCELIFFVGWFNEHRPPTWLDGRTPNEVYFGRRAANRRPRIEPRRRWPRSSRCAVPRTLVAGQPGDRFAIAVDFHAGRRHRPIVTLKRAA